MTLELDVVSRHNFDGARNQFLPVKVHLSMCHSLVSISKWEEKYQRPFLVSDDDKTQEELLDYISMMVVNDIPRKAVDEAISAITAEQMSFINDHIASRASATTFSDSGAGSSSTEIITSELIYYMMFANGISKECETWHINRLLALIRIFGIKNSPEKSKKLSQAEIMARNQKLNAERRAKWGTSG